MKGALDCCDVFPERRPARIGIAVSGGGDSLALLHYLRDAPGWSGVHLEAATVDHGLRSEAAQEAAFVAETCAQLGIAHTTLQWRDWDGDGNLQARARDARYALLAEWAQDHGCDAVAVGHSSDDQAETVLMNFARGSGVSGLRGMPRGFEQGGMRFIRPLIGVSRAALRGFLKEREQEWIEDPSNEDLRFTRVKARRLLDEAGELGLSPERLLDTAQRMADAEEVLVERAAQLLATLEIHAGDVLLREGDFRSAPRDTRHRALAAVLCVLSGNPYRPRFRPLATLADALDGVLHGCRVTSSAGTVRVAREASAAANCMMSPGETWDRRFRVFGPNLPGDEVRAMGRAAFESLPEARDKTIPRSSLAASPAVWRNGDMIAAPLAGIGSEWNAVFVQEPSVFVAALGKR